MDQNSPEEISFIILDSTRVDFDIIKSPYVIKQEWKDSESIKRLEEIASSDTDTTKHTFVHIEECNIFAQYPERAEKALRGISQKRKDVTILYSTSRIDPSDSVPMYLLQMTDMTVIFKVPKIDDIEYVLREVFKIPKPHEKIIAATAKTALLKAVPESDFKELVSFKF